MSTVATAERIWLDVHQAAEHAGYHWKTIQGFCASGELHGFQRVAGGKWRIHIECLDAWLSKQPCAHQLADTG